MKKISTEVVSRVLGIRLGAPILAAGMMAAMVLPSQAGPALTAVFGTGGLEPDGLVAAPIGATLYVNATGPAPTFDSHILAINTQFGTITASLALENLSVFPAVPSHGATAIAINPAGTYIFVVNFLSGTVDVVQQSTNTQIATIAFPSSGPLPIGATVTPNGKELWIACSATPPSFNNGTVKVISLEPKTFLAPLYLINTGASPNTVTFNSKGSVGYVLNGGVNGFVDYVRAKNFKILKNDVFLGNLDSPNPLAMAIWENSNLYIADGDSYLHDSDIATGDITANIYVFPTIGPGLQDIGQVVVSPDHKWAVTADTDIGAISVVDALNDKFSTFVGLPAGSHPYFSAFFGTTLYVGNYNNTGFGSGIVGGNLSISVITGF
jgi:YVTN family beta-propeller protein